MYSFIAWFDSKENKNIIEGKSLESCSQRRELFYYLLSSQT
ncbi:hypothetical protein CSB66_4039 [Enterobacter hormaechei]|nr:hypothetical protein CSC35_2118 [Enterobacter hormaechei]RCG83169.1 hypothetical protein CSB66_4039 [Enterobacter hormaechei]